MTVMNLYIYVYIYIHTYIYTYITSADKITKKKSRNI